MKLTFVLLALNTFLFCEGQSLTVGDKLPISTIKSIINGSADRVDSFILNGKILILDFFSTHCTSCIYALPRLDSLQKIYQSDIQILLVTSERGGIVNAFFKRHPKFKPPNLQIVTNDSILSKIFPHFLISHDIWIDNNSVIKAITGADYITVDHIKEILSGNEIKWPIKNDYVQFDYDQPLFVFNNNTKSNVLPETKFYSALTESINNASPFYKKIADTSKGSVRILIANLPIFRILQSTYQETFNRTPLEFPISHILLNAKDRSRATSELSEEQSNNVYCYEVVYPIKMPEVKVQKKIRSDLEIFFNLKVSLELRTVRSIAIERDGNKDSRVLSLTNKIRQNKYTPDDIKRAVPINDLVNWLNRKHWNLPFFNETGYKEEMYVLIRPNSYSDIDSLKIDLKEFGLKVKEKEKEVLMFIVNEN